MPRTQLVAALLSPSALLPEKRKGKKKDLFFNAKRKKKQKKKDLKVKDNTQEIKSVTS